MTQDDDFKKVECRVSLSKKSDKVAKTHMVEKDITNKGDAINDILEDIGDEK